AVVVEGHGEGGGGQDECREKKKQFHGWWSFGAGSWFLSKREMNRRWTGMNVGLKMVKRTSHRTHPTSQNPCSSASIRGSIPLFLCLLDGFESEGNFGSGVPDPGLGVEIGTALVVEDGVLK